MSTFQYSGTDATGATVKGSLEAASLDAARSALQDLHIQSTELHEATRHAQSDTPPGAPPPLLTTFAFEGTDPQGHVRQGTVQAESKYQAFEKLHHDQQLTLSMLSPVGNTPSYNDYELIHWQKKASAANAAPSARPLPKDSMTIAAAPPSTLPAVAAPPKRSGVAFTFTDASSPVAAKPTTTLQSDDEKPVHILAGAMDTLRLYAGWLLAWYGLFVVAGHYAHERQLPVVIPFAEGFYLSPLILTFTVGIFSFLVLHSIHRALRGRLVIGAALCIAWLGIVVLFRAALAS